MILFYYGCICFARNLLLLLKTCLYGRGLLFPIAIVNAGESSATRLYGRGLLFLPP